MPCFDLHDVKQFLDNFQKQNGTYNKTLQVIQKLVKYAHFTRMMLYFTHITFNESTIKLSYLVRLASRNKLDAIRARWMNIHYL